jgi:hypothetical protein
MLSRHLISRLLSGRNRLSRVEKDALRDAILARAAPAPPRRFGLAGPALAVAGAAALLLVIPWATRPGPEPAPEGRGELVARGASGDVAALNLLCDSSGEPRCRAGDTLHFDVSGASGFDYLAAFARRDDGAVIWYFPEAPGAGSHSIADVVAGGILDRGIAIGGDHPPGRYQVFAVFSRQALTRDEIAARFDEAGPSAGPDAAVVVREVIVQ